MKKEPIPIKTITSIIPISKVPKNMFQEVKVINCSIAQRAYELFQMRGTEDGHDLEDWFKAEHEVLQFVPFEMIETNENIVVTARIPGFEPKDLDIHVEANCLVIRGNNEKVMRKKNNGKVLYSETLGRRVFRSIEIPALVTLNKSRAVLVNDKLEIMLPKAKKPVKIEICELHSKAS